MELFNADVAPADFPALPRQEGGTYERERFLNNYKNKKP